MKKILLITLLSIPTLYATDGWGVGDFEPRSPSPLQEVTEKGAEDSFGADPMALRLVRQLSIEAPARKATSWDVARGERDDTPWSVPSTGASSYKSVTDTEMDDTPSRSGLFVAIPRAATTENSSMKLTPTTHELNEEQFYNFFDLRGKDRAEKANLLREASPTLAPYLKGPEDTNFTSVMTRIAIIKKELDAYDKRIRSAEDVPGAIYDAWDSVHRHFATAERMIWGGNRGRLSDEWDSL